MTGPLYVRPTWWLPGLAPWATAEERLEHELGPLGSEWGTPVGSPQDAFAEIADELSRQPQWRTWAERYDVAAVEATLVVEDRADRETNVHRDRSAIKVDHHIPAAVFGREDVALYEGLRQVVHEVWTATAIELGWEPPPALTPWRLPTPAAPTAPERVQPPGEPMPAEDFWAHVSVLGGAVTQGSAERMATRLAATSPDEIRGFADRLGIALHELDTRSHASQPVRDVDESPDDPLIPLSSDAFLHVRCAVVAVGQDTYERVRAEPTQLAGTWAAEEAEDLLFVAQAAWERLTGGEWDYQPVIDYESGSNRDGWP